MRAAERGKEIVQRVLVRQIHCRQLQAHLVPLSVKQIVVSDRKIEQVPRRNPRRILVGILGPGRWNRGQSG